MLQPSKDISGFKDAVGQNKSVDITEYMDDFSLSITTNELFLQKKKEMPEDYLSVGDQVLVYLDVPEIIENTFSYVVPFISNYNLYLPGYFLRSVSGI